MKDNNDIALWSWHRGLNGIAIGANRGGVALLGSTRSKLLYLGRYGDITGGKMPNIIDGGVTFLSVSGSSGAEVYECPNNATYKSADTDYIWFDRHATQRQVTTAELVGYDFNRTPVKYDNSNPYAIREILILKSGETLTSNEIDNLHQYCQLSIYWSGILNQYGRVKGNRGADKSVWSGYSPEFTKVLNALPDQPSATDALNMADMLDALVAGGYYAKAEFLDVFAADTENNALLDWRNPTGTHNPAKVNSPTFEQYAGFTGEVANTRCVRLKFIPATDCVAAGQDNMCYVIGSGKGYASGVDSGNAFGAQDGNGPHIRILPHSSTNTLLVRLNNAIAASPNTDTSAKHIAISRGNASNFDSYQNLVKTNHAIASTGVVNRELYACGHNAYGTITGTDTTLRYVFGFSYLTESEVQGVINIMEAYLDKYGTGLM